MSQSPPTELSNNKDSWENEGGSVPPDRLVESLGIRRHMSETYSVGWYHYTNLPDAIAQARRMVKLERELS